jgi:hypothetical protein
MNVDQGGRKTTQKKKMKTQITQLLYFSHDFAKQENITYLILAIKLP